VRCNRTVGGGRGSLKPAFASAHNRKASGIRQGMSLLPRDEAIERAIGVGNWLKC